MRNTSDKICTISIGSGGKKISTQAGENLLTLLTENSILLRSDCGGKGVCKKCMVEIDSGGHERTSVPACTFTVNQDLNFTIPEISLMSPHIINKSAVQLPDSFLRIFTDKKKEQENVGIAIDLGTTTIAVYLVDTASGKILSSLAVKNPQSLYGDDIMSRIGYIGQDNDNISRLRQLVSGAIDWAVNSLLAKKKGGGNTPQRMVIVGNPSMIHILLGISPASIGVAPYEPQFTDSRLTVAGTLGMQTENIVIRTLPQISGFIGGDILSAAVASELAEQPEGTLLLDLGTNGELMLKGRDRFYATSCATGPAFEGATLSCGIQAIPGAIDSVVIGDNLEPQITTVQNGPVKISEPVGICGSGIISGVAEFLRHAIIGNSGAFNPDLPPSVIKSNTSGRFFPLFSSPEKEIFINQKDIRNVQLGKAAVISGIEFLLAAAGLQTPTKIIVAGAFGSHLEKKDLLTLGLLPNIPEEKITIAGNSAGGGAVMVLCDERYLKMAEDIANNTTVINLADDVQFQSHFIHRLSF